MFRNEIKKLFALSKNISDKTFDYKQITELPQPVQQYFKYVLKQGQAYISFVRLTHDGKFKSDIKKDWMNIKGEQYFTTQQPGFIWRGKTSLFTARDMFLSNRGRITVKLFSVLTIVDGKGIKYNQGELLRWLGESVWFPTNLLPTEHLKWTAINSFAAKLTFDFNDLHLYYLVSFNERAEITQIETKRYMGENLEAWIGKLNDYKE